MSASIDLKIKTQRSLYVLAAIALAVGLWAAFFRSLDVDQLMIDAKRAMRQGRFPDAQRLVRDILDENPENPEALMISAVAAAELGAFHEAVANCSGISDPASPFYVNARCMAGNLHLKQLRKLSAAENEFRRALQVDENCHVAIRQLAHIFNLQTRTWEASAQQLKLLRSGTVSTEIAASLAQGSLLFTDPILIHAFRQAEPDHAGLFLAESRAAMLRDDREAAEKSARAALKSDSTLDEAYIRLGQIMAANDAVEQLHEWQTELPTSARSHPESWVVLGKLAELHADRKGAARCFWEAGRIDSASRTASYSLGRNLAALGRDKDAEVFFRRARLLEKYRKLFESGPILTDQQLFEGHSITSQLGLTWESIQFASIASQSPEPPAWASEAVRSFEANSMDSVLTRVNPEQCPFRRIDLTEYALPAFTDKNAGHISSQTRQPSTPEGAIRFEDVAVSSGVNFRFRNGADPDISGAQRPYDFTGGGIAVADIDGDTWPDLLFSQGGAIDDGTGTATHGDRDRLFRNQRGSSFADVSTMSFSDTSDYSQGVAAGDINNDGFVDLLIGNLGNNRLLINNGDGTFSDDSSRISGDSSQWTTSCAIADLNGDGWADLYTVNYLSGDIISRVCRDHSGRIAPCAPQNFPAAQDQVFVSDGAGSFIDQTAESGIEVPEGKGLGLVVVDLSGDRKPDLVIANDGVPNFLFENQSDAGKLRFREVGMQRGIGVNRNGLSEAGMGLVAEDLDLDGHEDLFVTNFLDETNTLHRGSKNMIFEDATLSSRLGLPSRSVLGFGVQALDADLDGLPDLFVANGHVDDFSDRDVSYHMPPHFFRNAGQLQFDLLSPEDTGSYFTGSYLGRTVVRLDWDRDGDEDLVVGTLDQNTALLNNVSQRAGNSVSVQVRCRTLQRDGIGTRVTVIKEDGSVTRQLSAGDGYLANNERQILFAVGDQDVAALIVRWPDGTGQKSANIQETQSHFVIQGRGNVYVVPK